MKNIFLRKNVAVFFGGNSVEHDISIITGVQTINALNKEKFCVYPIYITRENRFLTSEDYFDMQTFSKGLETKKGQEVLLKNGELFFVKRNKLKRVCKLDFVFLATHGGSGENGELEGLIDMNNLPSSSSGVLGSSIGMDKILTKKLCETMKIPVCDYEILTYLDSKENVENVATRVLKKLELPVIVKPATLGSSIGITVCDTREKLKNAISFAFLFDVEVIVEKAVENLREYNIAVLGNNFVCEASNIEDVTDAHKFLSFESKYLSDGKGKGMENLGREFPAKIDENLKSKIENISKTFFLGAHMKGAVRLDFLYDEGSGELYLNEANTIPGSLANYLWRDKYYNFSKVLEKMMAYSVQEFEVRSAKIKRFSSNVLTKCAFDYRK